ncbi:MAG: hypothetical protein AB7G28_20780 [Pirellulales bacterium]
MPVPVQDVIAAMNDLGVVLEEFNQVESDALAKREAARAAGEASDEVKGRVLSAVAKVQQLLGDIQLRNGQPSTADPLLEPVTS